MAKGANDGGTGSGESTTAALRLYSAVLAALGGLSVRRLFGIGVVATMALLADCVGAEGAVVFGSFGDARTAQEVAGDVEERLQVPVRIVTVKLAGRRYRRVLATGMATEAEAKALVARGQNMGFKDVWYWPDAPARMEDVPAEPPERIVADGGEIAKSVVQARKSAPKRRRWRWPFWRRCVARADESARPSLAATATPACQAPSKTSAQAEAAPAVGSGLRLAVKGNGEETIVVSHFDEVDIRIDGRLDEAVWAQLPGYDSMVLVEPDTLAEPRHRTVARYLYTDQGLYVGVWNEQPPETLIARLSSRDDYINRDGWGITLDTSGEGLYGYWFNVGLGGSVLDGKVAPERTFTREWDGPWDSATAELDDGWSLEAFLPWSMMTMPQASGERVMGVYTNRKVAYVDERWGWPALPFTGARFMSALQPMNLPGVQPKPQLAAFPYTSTDFDAKRGEQGYQAGVDVFWRPSTNFQVTATAFPDFGAVESDDVVVNLTAQETYFPEKRLFFMEGSEIFTTSVRSRVYRGYGSGARRSRSTYSRIPSALLNTRRIGGAAIGVEVPEGVAVPDFERSRPTDLVGAAKVTGQSGRFRYGTLVAVEDDPELRGELDNGRSVRVRGDGRNFGVARVLYESTGKSRRSIGYLGTLLSHPSLNAKVHGIDAHHQSASGKWRTDVQGMASDVDGETGYGVWADLEYTQRQGVTHSLSLDYQDRQLDINAMGFLNRNDLIGGRYSTWLSRSDVPWLRRWSGGVNVGHWVNGEGQQVSSWFNLFSSFTFHNRDQLRAMVNVAPPQWDDLESRGNGAFRMRSRTIVEVSYGTDTSKPLSWSVQAGRADETIKSAAVSIGAGFTYKPLDRVSVDFDLTRRKQDAWLLWQGGANFATYRATHWQPRVAVDLFITARQQLRMTMQWAGIRAKEQEFWRVSQDGRMRRVGEDPSAETGFAISRLTAQLRYRWEIAPLSDLFVVYTRGSNLDNRVDDEFGDLFQDAMAQPLVDRLVIKLRYRFGR